MSPINCTRSWIRRSSALAAILAIAFGMVATSCRTKSAPEPRYFILNTPNAATESDISLARLDMAAYLNQSSIVLEIDSNELRPARYRLWAEPLRDGVARYLTASWGRSGASRLGTWRLSLAIDAFHGSEDGHVVLIGGYTLEANGAEPVARRFQLSANQDGEGYASMVRAHEACLDQLARMIAADAR